MVIGGGGFGLAMQGCAGQHSWQYWGGGVEYAVLGMNLKLRAEDSYCLFSSLFLFGGNCLRS